MPIFTWSERFSVYVPEMDRQHKKLVYMLNCLHDSLLEQQEQDVLGTILDGLVDYTKTHFQREEELMEQCGFNCRNSHKAIHDDLAQKVMGIREKYYTGDQKINTDLTTLLNDWLAEHIMIEDKRYSPYMAGVSVNIEKLDQQHKELTDIISEFCDKKFYDAKKVDVMYFLDGLTEYSVEHFKTEEDLMKQHEYPDYKPHQLEHEDLAKRILLMKKKFGDGDENIDYDMEKFISEGLINHIFLMDKQYVPFLNGKGVT